MTKVKAQLRTNLKSLKKIDMKSIIKSRWYKASVKELIEHLK